MGDTAGLDPMSIEFCDRTIKDLKSQVRELSKMIENFAEQADPKHRKKRCKKSLKRKINHPATRKKLLERADLEDAKKHAKKIDSLDKDIKYMEKRKKCIIMAAKKSISLEAAVNLVREEESLKDKKKQQKVKRKPVEEPTSESTFTEASSLPPPVHRYPSYPKGCDFEEYQKWMQEYDRVQDLNAATNNLPTQTYDHKDPATVAAVVDPDDKTMLIDVAKAIVNVNISYPIEFQDLVDLDGCCSGVIIKWNMDNKTARILTCGCFGHDIDGYPKSKISVCWPYKEDAGLIEAELLLFSTFYQLSLLEVAFPGTLPDVLAQIPPFGLSPPKHGDEVFALGRDKDLSLVVRRGTIMQEQHLDKLCQGYLFVDYELPECGSGGPVVDHHGDVVGLSVPSGEGISVILPISTALSCVNMWTEFGRIARPLLGMCCRNVELPDGLSGLVVDKFEGLLLSYGLKYLQETYKEVDFKLELQDACGVKRHITLHVPFSDVANVVT